jgi:hypothetical protein
MNPRDLQRTGPIRCGGAAKEADFRARLFRCLGVLGFAGGLGGFFRGEEGRRLQFLVRCRLAAE